MIACINTLAQSEHSSVFKEKLDSIVYSTGSKEIYKYDDEGRLIEHYYYIDNSITTSDTYSYNGDIQEKTTISYSNGEQTYLHRTVRAIGHFDEYGDPLLLEGEQIDYDRNKGYKYENKFDDNWNCILSEEFDYSNGEWIRSSYIKYEYDSEDHKIKESHYHRENGVMYLYTESIYEYDNEGRNIKKIFFGYKEGVLSGHSEYCYEYDNEGHVTRERRYEAIDGELHISYEVIRTYIGELVIKQISNTYTCKDGEDILEISYVSERDSKGYYLMLNNDVYDNKYDRYGDITESVVSHDGHTVRKAEFSYDSEGNLVVVLYNHSSIPDGYYPYDGQWYKHEKHVIITNNADEIQSVKVYQYANNKWNLACEGVSSNPKITIPEYVGGYALHLTPSNYTYNYLGSCHWEITEPSVHGWCCSIGVHTCYDLDGNVIAYNGDDRFDNEYGGYTRLYTSGGTEMRTRVYNQFDEEILYKQVKLVNGKQTTVYETITDEYYKDFIPIAQTRYKNGQINYRRLKHYDWNVDACTIAGSETKHYKLLSTEMIYADGSSSVTRYYYSNFGPDSPAGLKSIGKSSGTMSIYGVTGAQRQQLQKGMNIINEGGKVRKVIVK